MLTFEEAVRAAEQEIDVRWVVGFDPLWTSSGKPYYCNLEDHPDGMNEQGFPIEGCSRVATKKRRTHAEGDTPAAALEAAIQNWREGKFRC